MIKQYSKVILQEFHSAFLELLFFDIEFGQDILFRQLRQYTTAVMLNQLMIQKLKIIESSMNDGIIVFAVFFSTFYRIQLVANKVTLFDDLRLLYLNDPVKDETIVILNVYSCIWP